jgi:transcriptional regulator with XRE-family HTH domain
VEKTDIEKALKIIISDKLQQIKKQGGYVLEQMAEEIGIEYPTFYSIYKGHNLPRLVTLYQISRAYGIPVSFWFQNLERVVPSKKEQRRCAVCNNTAVLRVFDNIDAETGGVILKVLRAYARKQRRKK